MSVAFQVVSALLLIAALIVFLIKSCGIRDPYSCIYQDI